MTTAVKSDFQTRTQPGAAGSPAGVYGIEPSFREAGTGPGVVLLHANASTGGQWRALMDVLAPHYRVLAADLYGSGQSPDWPSDRVISLRDEVDFIEPVMARAGSPPVLVGHSYGAAVALVAAVSHPETVRAVAVFEPTLFAVLDADGAPANAADGIRSVLVDASASLDAGDENAAAERFIDYWMGDGSWSHIPEQRKAPIAASVRNIRRWGHALLTEATPLAAFQALDIPVLYMVGKRSPASSRAVAQVLTNALPRVEVVEFEDLGHMGPVTHPDRVNAVIARFLRVQVIGNTRSRKGDS
jgi:pimeloyl-ACP methyl ester carboxylesterase